jgi:hypothetical protein
VSPNTREEKRACIIAFLWEVIKIKATPEPPREARGPATVDLRAPNGSRCGLAAIYKFREAALATVLCLVLIEKSEFVVVEDFKKLVPLDCLQRVFA